MDALWIKQGNSLVPADPVTEERLAQVKNGARVMTSEPKKRRNPDFHRYMMAILQVTLENAQGDFADLDELHFRRVADRWRWIISTDQNLLPGTDPDSLLSESLRRAA